jgi:hypothetical protein
MDSSLVRSVMPSSESWWNSVTFGQPIFCGAMAFQTGGQRAF